jgi:hypothetical protein
MVSITMLIPHTMKVRSHILTFIQPALWLRLLIDTVLLAGLRLAYHGYKPQRGEHG